MYRLAVVQHTCVAISLMLTYAGTLEIKTKTLSVQNVSKQANLLFPHAKSKIRKENKVRVTLIHVFMAVRKKYKWKLTP